jgi:hypothetical protein
MLMLFADTSRHSQWIFSFTTCYMLQGLACILYPEEHENKVSEEHVSISYCNN